VSQINEHIQTNGGGTVTFLCFWGITLLAYLQQSEYVTNSILHLPETDEKKEYMNVKLWIYDTPKLILNAFLGRHMQHNTNKK
jgi:hypothetical protein